jgi:hypothetical protein
MSLSSSSFSSVLAGSKRKIEEIGALPQKEKIKS